MLSLLTFNVIKVLFMAAVAASAAFVLSPFLIRLLHRLHFWKKEARQKAISGEQAAVFHGLHQQRETTVPRGGGAVIWTTVLGLAVAFFLLAQVIDVWWLKKLNFIDRGQTWLPLFTLLAASLVGLTDDILQVWGRGSYIGGGMGFLRRLLIVTLIGAIGAWWFYAKLGYASISIPFAGEVYIGFLYVLLFILVMLGAWAGGVVDGLDGLAGGVFLSIFGAFGIIAFSQGQIELTAMIAAVIGALFAFLWFNIPPARFYMGETGILGLTTTMAVIAFLTDSVVVLPIIAGILVLEVGTVILQLLSKKFRGKKIWRSTPIHHHLEAIGWLPHQVTMRFWILGIILAIAGVAIRLAG